MPKRRNTHLKKTTHAFLSTTLPQAKDQTEVISSIGQADFPLMTTSTEPQLTLNATKTKDKETACLMFIKITFNLQEHILVEEADTNQSHGGTNLGKSFAIEDFEEVIAHVEEAEEELNTAHDVKMSKLAIRGKNGKGVDVELDERMETVASACRSVQLFNIDKRFGFCKEDTRQLVAQAGSWSGRKLERAPKTLRQIFNDPMCLLEADAPTKMQKRPEATNSVVLSKFRRLSKLALQDVQKIITEENAELSLIPTTAIYRGCRLPDTVPEKIRQSVCDLQFIKESMTSLQEQLLPVRETVRDAMLIWITAGRAAWEYGTAHMHEYPNMKKYEYLRTSLQAENLLAHREEHKILSYFLSGGRSEGVCPGMQTKLSKDGQDLNMSSKDWDDRKQRLMDGFLPVEEMVKRLKVFDSPEVGETNIVG